MAAVIGREGADEGGGAVESGDGDGGAGAGGGTGWTVDPPRPRFNFQVFTFLSAYSCQQSDVILKDIFASTYVMGIFGLYQYIDVSIYREKLVSH